MNFNKHYELKNKHAFFSPSKHYWLRWDEEKIRNSYINAKAVEKGTRLHNLAAECISLGIKLKDNKTTLSMYVNDALSYKMTPEVALFYSDNCFGHTDAISFKRNILRIFDLKTGEITTASMEQLLIYAALFCLEYHIDPKSIKYDLRIYQFDKAICYEPNGDEIAEIIDIIVHHDMVVESMNMEE